MYIHIIYASNIHLLYTYTYLSQERKHQAQMVSMVNFTRKVNEKIMLLLYNLLQKIEAEEILPDSICKVSLILISESGKDTTTKETIDQYLS